MADGWRIEVVRQGHENQPVVIIDDFAADPDALIDDAATLAFRPMGEHYPGIRAVVAMPIVRTWLERLGPVIAATFGYRDRTLIDAFYSLVTTTPAALSPAQRLPHIDGVEPERLALLHYLSRDERGGTAFYRHRATGFETVDAMRLPAYRAALGHEIARDGMPEARYIAGDTPIFGEIAVHRGRFNRAILYRSNMLHCARLPDDLALDGDPLTGRLTVNTFLRGC